MAGASGLQLSLSLYFLYLFHSLRNSFVANGCLRWAGALSLFLELNFTFLVISSMSPSLSLQNSLILGNSFHKVMIIILCSTFILLPTSFLCYTVPIIASISSLINPSKEISSLPRNLQKKTFRSTSIIET